MTYTDTRLNSIIGMLYDAAIGECSWPAAIESCIQFVGGSSGALFSKDALNSSGNIYHEFGTDPHWVKKYFSHYVASDPTTTVQYFADIGQAISISDIMPYEEFLQTTFYKEWVEPQSLADCLNAVLDKSATSVAMFCAFRTQAQGAVDDDMRRRMGVIIPHVRRAVLIGRLFEREHSRASAFENTLNKVAAGVFLVDANGRIAHANDLGETMLLSGDLIRRDGGKIAARNLQAELTLRDCLGAAANGDLALGTKGVAIPLTSNEDVKYVAHLLPLTSGTRRKATSGNAIAALFIREASLGSLLPPEVIGRAFGLTPTELRVLLAIVEVGGVPETASALGIASTTVKTHLNRLYEKTGVNRQADLVKLVAGYTKITS